MTFYKFTDSDIVDTFIYTNPSYSVESNGDVVSGSVYLERPYLTSSLNDKIRMGFSRRLGGLVTGSGPLTSSIELIDVEKDVTNNNLYSVLSRSYDFYSSYLNTAYSLQSTQLRVINIPEIYYDKNILTGSFTASDIDSEGNSRNIYDNGRGGLYSGSLTGTLMGHIFYSEGVAVLTASNLTDFGAASSTNFDWKVSFKGVHKIPVKIFRCRAPAGQLNASTNPTFYSVPSAGDHKNARVPVFSQSFTYVTTIGLFNENYQLVGVAKLAQPIKKELQQDILFRLRMDF